MVRGDDPAGARIGHDPARGRDRDGRGAASSCERPDARLGQGSTSRAPCPPRTSRHSSMRPRSHSRIRDTAVTGSATLGGTCMCGKSSLADQSRSELRESLLGDVIVHVDHGCRCLRDREREGRDAEGPLGRRPAQDRDAGCSLGRRRSCAARARPSARARADPTTAWPRARQARNWNPSAMGRTGSAAGNGGFSEGETEREGLDADDRGEAEAPRERPGWGGEDLSVLETGRAEHRLRELEAPPTIGNRDEHARLLLIAGAAPVSGGQDAEGREPERLAGPGSPRAGSPGYVRWGRRIAASGGALG